jgi:glycosyltransferase involved in cell wall biosynthesis
MNIAVNTRLLLKNKLDGIGWFTFQTLKRITQNHPEHQFIFLFDRPYDPVFIFGNNVNALVVAPPARHPVLWYWWFEKMLPAVLREVKADIFLSPDGFIPLSLEIPAIPVIHDINFHHRPGDLPLASRIYYRYFFPKFARRAKRIVTVSEYSKADISQSYHIDPIKIDVVYNGAHELYKPLSEAEKQIAKLKYSDGDDYFVFVGSLHPRKNVDGLLKGFDEFRSSRPSRFKLLIVGEKFFMNTHLEKAYSRMRFKSEVIFTGRKEPEELSEIVGAAWSLAFVPHFEGFGIPLLEAMLCNVPSVASKVTSLPEVAGNTAVYVDPSDIHSISDGLETMAFDTDFRNTLILNCGRQHPKFSWDKTALKLWSSIEKAF